MGYAPPPPSCDGVPIQLGWGTPLAGIGYTWTAYAAGGTPLAVSRRRNILFTIFFAEIQRAPLEQIVLQIKTLDVFRGRDVEVYLFVVCNFQTLKWIVTSMSHSHKPSIPRTVIIL